MDRLTQEKEIAVQEKVQDEVSEVEQSAEEVETLPQEKQSQEVFVSAPPPNSYLNSFENITISDIKKEEEKKKQQQAQQVRQQLVEEELARQEEQRMQQEEALKQQSATEEPKSVNIIEKPNYDLLEEPQKLVKLKTQSSKPKRKNAKKVGLALAVALGASGIICVTNCVLIDHFQSSFLQIEESYNLRLGKYLQDINNLDATKKGMELIETYPDKLLDAGDLGQKSNWFDRLCNFLGGLFGG